MVSARDAIDGQGWSDNQQGANQSLMPLQNAANSLAFRPFEYNDHLIWNSFFEVQTTPAQIWSNVTDPLLTQIRDMQPTNFAILIHKIVGKLADIIFASKGELAAVKPLQPFANTFTASIANATTVSKGCDDPIVVGTVPVILNCVRILTRILSLLVEDPNGPWWSSYMWAGELPFGAIRPPPGQVIDPIIQKGQFGQKPLGEVILLLLLDLLFVEGFTVHPSLATTVPNKQALRHTGVQLDKLYEISWSPTTGFPIAGPPNLPNIRQWLNKSVGWSNYDSNRTEVLRCLMVALSEQMFLPPLHLSASQPPPPSTPSSSSSSRPPTNRFLREFVSESSLCARWTPTLFWSLLNIILNFHPEGTTIIGYQLPYNYTIYTDYREPLVEVALHFLLIVTDFRHGESTLPSSLASPTLEARKNAVVVLNPPVKKPEEVAEESKQQQEEEHKTATDPTDVAVQVQPTETHEAGDKTGTTPTLAHVTSTTDSPSKLASSLSTISLDPMASSQPSNVFHAIFTELSNGPCLTSIYNNICRLLMNALAVESTYLPQSIKKMYAFQELLILTWKFVDENPNFLHHILHPPVGHAEHLDILHLVTPLLYFVHESRKDESQLGLMYTGVFLLLKLSGDREFSVALNRPVYSVPNIAHIPLFSLLEMPNIAGGTYADCLIVVAHKLIVSSPNHLDALLKVLLTLLCNVSPYLTKLSLFASVKLLNLFELFSSPKFVNANSTNHQYATFLLDLFNNIIQYQYLGHANLVYSIIRRAKLFFELGRLEPLPGAPVPVSVEEHQRALQQQAAAVAKHVDLSGPKTSGDARRTIEMAEIPPTSQQPQHTSGQVIVMASEPSSSTAFSHAFVPTAQWANSWKRMLPLEPIFRLLEFFEPKVEAMIKANHGVIDEAKIISMIGSTTLVGVLPVPHPIVVRKYIPNSFTNHWFSTFQFGIIFLRMQSLANLNYGICSMAPLWNPHHVKMFVIAPQRLTPQQLMDNQAREKAIKDQQAQEQKAKESTIIAQSVPSATGAAAAHTRRPSVEARLAQAASTGTNPPPPMEPTSITSSSGVPMAPHTYNDEDMTATFHSPSATPTAQPTTSEPQTILPRM